MTEFHVTLNTAELDAEQRRARAIRARELLEGAKWVFDEYIADQARNWMVCNRHDDYARRESFHTRVQAATEVLGHLMSIVNQQAYEDERNERRTRADKPDDHA